MKTLLLICSLVICNCLASPFFFGQQGVVATSSSASYTYPASVVAAFTSTGSGSFSDGAAIDTLTAVAGSGTVTQGTAANRPTYIATGGPSSLPCWRFDGTDRLKSANMTINQPFTMAVICKRTSDPYFGGNISPIGADAAYVGLSSRLAGSSPNPMGMYAGTAVSPTANIATNTWAIVVGVFNGASSKLFVNGAAAVTGNPGSSGTTSAGYSLGSWLNEPWVGDICAAAVFSAALSDSDAAALIAEWNRIYAIY